MPRATFLKYRPARVAACRSPRLRAEAALGKAQSEPQGYILLARGRKGAPSCVNRRAGGKRVCGGFRSLNAYGQ